MDPYEIEIQDRRKVRSRRSESVNRSFLDKIRTYVVSLNGNWVLKENAASDLDSIVPTVVKYLNYLVEEGLLREQCEVPKSERIKYLGREVTYQEGKWKFKDSLFEHFKNWGSLGRRVWNDDGIPIGRQPSSRTIQKIARKRPLKTCKWNGKAYYIDRNSLSYLEATKEKKPGKTKTGICVKCGSEVPFRGKNARRVRGHSPKECNTNLVKDVMCR